MQKTDNYCPAWKEKHLRKTDVMTSRKNKQETQIYNLQKMGALYPSHILDINSWQWNLLHNVLLYMDYTYMWENMVGHLCSHGRISVGPKNHI